MVCDILCRDCEHVYVGETKRTLKRGNVEHKQEVKQFDENNEVAVHANIHDHHINWEEAKVVTVGQSFGGGKYKRVSGSEHRTVP